MTKDRLKSTPVNYPVIGTVSLWAVPALSRFHVAPALRKLLEAEVAQDLKDVAAGEVAELRQSGNRIEFQRCQNDWICMRTKGGEIFTLQV